MALIKISNLQDKTKGYKSGNETCGEDDDDRGVRKRVGVVGESKWDIGNVCWDIWSVCMRVSRTNVTIKNIPKNYHEEAKHCISKVILAKSQWEDLLWLGGLCSSSGFTMIICDAN